MTKLDIIHFLRDQILEVQAEDHHIIETTMEEVQKTLLTRLTEKHRLIERANRASLDNLLAAWEAQQAATDLLELCDSRGEGAMVGSELRKLIESYKREDEGE